jgi:hypothetical protein
MTSEKKFFSFLNPFFDDIYLRIYVLNTMPLFASRYGNLIFKLFVFNYLLSKGSIFICFNFSIRSLTSLFLTNLIRTSLNLGKFIIKFIEIFLYNLSKREILSITQLYALLNQYRFDRSHLCNFHLRMGWDEHDKEAPQ